MLDLRDRAVLFRDKALWVTIQAIGALCLVLVMAGPDGGGSRWEPFGFAVANNLFGRVALWFNVYVGSKWRCWFYGEDPRP